MTTRIAVIGAGAWGINHVRALVGEPRCEVAAIVDPDTRARARAAPLAPNARALETSVGVLADPGIDAVVIAAPARTHAHLACAALEARKHVLVEKPLALTLADAEEIRAAERRSGRVAMVGHLMIHHPAVLRLRELFRSGQLGELYYLHSTRVNLGRLRHDENALWSFGPHDLSMIDFLLEQMPLSVAATGQSVLQPGVEDVVFLTLRYPGRATAHIHLSWLNPRKERRLTLVCSQKMVEFDDVAPDKLKVYDKGYDRPPQFTDYGQYLTLRDGDIHIPQLPMQEPLRVQLAHFLDCIEHGGQPRNDIASGVRITRVLAAAQTSLERSGIPVEIELSGAGTPS